MPRPIFCKVVRKEDGTCIGYVDWINKIGESRRESTWGVNFNHLRKNMFLVYRKYRQPILYHFGDSSIAYMRYKRGGLWI